MYNQLCLILALSYISAGPLPKFCSENGLISQNNGENKKKEKKKKKKKEDFFLLAGWQRKAEK